MRTHSLTVVLLFSIVAFLTGCYSSNPEDISAFMKPQEVETSTDNYILQPPDEVLVSCSDVPAIDNKRQTIRPDGKISLEDIGEIQAAGITPEQLAEKIRLKVIHLYQFKYEKPVNVTISVYRSKFYYVLGQVYSSGPKLYTGRDTVSRAISRARPNLLARLKHVQVIKPSSDKNVKPAVFELDYDRLMAHGDNSKDVLLQDGDIIYVPPTIFGWLAMKAEEFITPIQRAFTGAYSIGRSLNYSTSYYYSPMEQ
jgi:polysaccharide export outer membrane protein